MMSFLCWNKKGMRVHDLKGCVGAEDGGGGLEIVGLERWCAPLITRSLI